MEPVFNLEPLFQTQPHETAKANTMMPFSILTAYFEIYSILLYQKWLAEIGKPV